MAHTSVILALFPAERFVRPLRRVARRLPGGGTPAAQMHVTLAYLGDVAALTGQRDRVIAALLSFIRADDTRLINLPVAGVRRMDHVDEDKQAIAATIGGEGIRSYRQDLVSTLEAQGVPIDERWPTFIPHLTLGYVPATSITPPIRVPRVIIPAGELCLCWGDERIVLPMLGTVEKAGLFALIDTYLQTPEGRQVRAAMDAYDAASQVMAKAQTAMSVFDWSRVPHQWTGATTKPFRSRAQWRWAWATGQPWARRWSEETPGGKGQRFRRLPTKVAKKLQQVATAHGAVQMKAALVDEGTIVWAVATKAGERIAGQLCRAKNGLYVNCNSPQATQESKDKLKEQEREQKRQARDAEKGAKRRENQAKVAAEAGLPQNQAEALIDFANPDEPQALSPENAKALMDAGLVEQNPDGSYRISGAGRSFVAAANAGDVGRARDAMGRGADRAQRSKDREAKRQERDRKKQERDAERQRKQAERDAKKKQPKKGGGGGGGKGDDKKPEKPKRQPRSSRRGAGSSRAGASGGGGGGSSRSGGASERGPDTSDADAAIRGADAALRRIRAERRRAPVTAPAAAPAPKPRPDIRRRLDERRRKKRQPAPAPPRRDDRLTTKVRRGHTYWRAFRQERKAGRSPAEARTAAREARRRRDLGRLERRRNRLLTWTPAASGFSVFKTRDGRLRWVSFSSNGYRDRDQQHVSVKALTADVARTDQDGQYGPLRWWHEGDPDPSNPDAPWGPGVDIGWCDYSAMSGPCLIESGTFVDDRIGEAIAAKADQYATSLGFFHPISEPDADGVFHHIRRFERSLAPKDRVSNPFTSFVVPTHSQRKAMNTTKKVQLQQLLDTMPPDEVDRLIAQGVQRTQTAAKAAGVALKADQAQATQPVYQLPDGTPAIIVGGQLVQLKALPMAGEEAEKAAPGAAAAGMAADAAADAEALAEEAEAETEDAEAEDDTAYAADLSVDDFKAMLRDVLSEALKPLVGQLKMTDKMQEMVGKMGEELKGYMSGVGQKADEGESELRQELATVKAELAALKGDTPRAIAAASRSSRSVVAEVQTPEQATVATKSGQPAYSSPFDAVGGWLEGSQAGAD